MCCLSLYVAAYLLFQIHGLCTGPWDKAPSSKGSGSSVLKEQYFTSAAINLEKTL